MIGRNFYIIDNDYLQYLRQFDDKVPLNEYENNQKFFFGLLININEFKYFVPVSHFNRRQKTNMVIYDRYQNPISSLRFCFMIPIVPSKAGQLISRIDLTNKDIRYINLVDYEENYCLLHLNEINTKATFVYNKVVNQRNAFYINNCCNFSRLEIAASEY